MYAFQHLGISETQQEEEDAEKEKYALQHVAVKIYTHKHTYKYALFLVVCLEWLSREGEAQNKNRIRGQEKRMNE